jgi:hypothetical protein
MAEKARAFPVKAELSKKNPDAEQKLPELPGRGYGRRKKIRGVVKMLFMDVSTWDPSNRDKILEHFKKLEIPDGIDVINQWVDLSGNRYYILYEAESAEAYGAFNLPWSDICVIDSVPVMEASEFMQLLPKYKK